MIIKDDDNNNDNANNDNGDQTIIIFQIRHFREPIAREKTTFSAFPHMQVYSY